MTISGVATFPIIILDGETIGQPISSILFGDCASILVYAPGTLGETYTIQVHHDPRATGLESNWRTLVDSAGSNIIPPVATKAKWFTELSAAGSFRFVANIAVTSDVTFWATKLYTG